MTRKNSWIWLVVLAFVVSCSNDPLDVDVSDIKVEIGFTDINETIMNADSANLIAKHKAYKKDLTNIYAYLIGYCMEIGEVSDTAFYNSIVQFRADSMIQKLNGNLDSEFKNKDELRKNIIEGFKHLKYHLPDCKIPSDIVYINSLFRSGIFCTEEEIGIGLQQFLGADNEVIQKLDPQFYYDWMKQGFEAEYLERDVLTGWISTHCAEEEEGNLAEQIVRWGKVLYLTEAAFPDKEQHLILRYSKEDLDWAMENEYAFWKYLVDEKLLFKIDDHMTRNMIGDGPFTPGLPEQDGPDRLGQFIGWRMVHMYMDKYEIPLTELNKLTYNDILQEYEIE